MSTTIDRETLLALINRFYAAYDPARQFDEAFSLYQSVVSGERDAVEVMNALYETYPSAKSNLVHQAWWRFRSSEFEVLADASSNPQAVSIQQNINNLLQLKFGDLINVLDQTFQQQDQGGCRPDLFPKNNDQNRMAMQVREIVAAYDTSSENAKRGPPMWTYAQARQLVEDIESELGKPLYTPSDDASNQQQENINNIILKEIERFFASKATDDQKQRAAFWRVVFESDVANINSVDNQIAACNGNAVQATRLFRENLRKAMVRIDGNLTASSSSARKNNSSNENDDDGGVSIPGSENNNKQNNNNSTRSGSQTPLPGGDARSSSAQDKKSIEHLRSVLERGNAALEANEKRLREREQELAAKSQRTPEDLARFAAIRDELNARERDLQEVQQECQNAANRLNERQLQLEAWEKALTMRESELSARQQSLTEKEEQHLVDSQKRAEALQVSAAAVLRREQMADVKEHVIGQRESEVKRKEESLIEKEHSTDRRAEAIVQRSLELERLMAEYELRSMRVKQREAAIWKSYVNQQIATADPSTTLSSNSVNSSTLQNLSKELKSVRGHLERLGTVAGSFNNTSTTTGTPSNNKNNNTNTSSSSAAAVAAAVVNEHDARYELHQHSSSSFIGNNNTISNNNVSSTTGYPGTSNIGHLSSASSPSSYTFSYQQ